MNQSYPRLKQAKPTLRPLALLVALLVLVSLFASAQTAAAQADETAASDGVSLSLAASGEQTADSTMPVQAAASVGQCVEDRYHAAGNNGPINCTANDVVLSQYTLISGPTSCLPGEQISVVLRGRFVANCQ